MTAAILLGMSGIGNHALWVIPPVRPRTMSATPITVRSVGKLSSSFSAMVFLMSSAIGFLLTQAVAGSASHLSCNRSPSFVPKDRKSHVLISGPHPSCWLGVFASYWQKSRVYVIRFTCELPYAVGLGRTRHNLLHALRESKEKRRPSGVLSSVPLNSYTAQICPILIWQCLRR